MQRRVKKLGKIATKRRIGNLSDSGLALGGGAPVTPQRATGARVVALASGDGPPTVLGPSIGRVNAVNARTLVWPTGDQENGIIIKVPSSTYGDDGSQPYGTGQAILVLDNNSNDAKADQGAATNPVLFRVTGGGALGMTGNFHLATGLRGFPSNYAAFINPAADMIGVLIKGAGADTKEYIVCQDPTGAHRMSVKGRNLVLNDGHATRVALGEPVGFSLPAITFGSAGDAALFRDEANSISTGAGDRLRINDSYLQIDELAVAPATPPADTARIYAGASGTKTSLAVKWPSGAVTVIATEP